MLKSDFTLTKDKYAKCQKMRKNFTCLLGSKQDIRIGGLWKQLATASCKTPHPVCVRYFLYY